MLQHLLPIQLESLLSLPSCMWFCIVMERGYAVSRLNLHWCFALHMQEADYTSDLYICQLSTLQSCCRFGLYDIWRAHVQTEHAVPTFQTSISISLAVASKTCPLVNIYHVWCLFLPYFWNSLNLGRNRRHYIVISLTVGRLLLCYKIKEMWRIDLVSLLVLVAYFLFACSLLSSHLYEFRERKLIQNNWWCQVALSCVSDLFVDTLSKMVEMFAFHAIVY
jgi:hypothetical protein